MANADNAEPLDDSVTWLIPATVKFAPRDARNHPGFVEAVFILEDTEDEVRIFGRKTGPLSGVKKGERVQVAQRVLSDGTMDLSFASSIDAGPRWEPLSNEEATLLAQACIRESTVIAKVFNHLVNREKIPNEEAKAIAVTAYIHTRKTH